MNPTSRDSGYDVSANGRSVATPPVADIVRDAAVTTIFLQGDIDLNSASTVRAVIEDECDRHPAKLVVDLAAVEFVDSSALHLLVALHRRLIERDCILVIASPSETLWRSFVVTNLDGTLLFEGAPAA